MNTYPKVLQDRDCFSLDLILLDSQRTQLFSGKDFLDGTFIHYDGTKELIKIKLDDVSHYVIENEVPCLFLTREQILSKNTKCLYGVNSEFIDNGHNKGNPLHITVVPDIILKPQYRQLN